MDREWAEAVTEGASLSDATRKPGEVWDQGDGTHCVKANTERDAGTQQSCTTSCKSDKSPCP
jgi:hypothetical protein